MKWTPRLTLIGQRQAVLCGVERSSRKKLPLRVLCWGMTRIQGREHHVTCPCFSRCGWAVCSEVKQLYRQNEQFQSYLLRVLKGIKESCVLCLFKSMRCILLMGRVVLFLMAYKTQKNYIYLNRHVQNETNKLNNNDNSKTNTKPKPTNPKHSKSIICASVLVCVDICVHRYKHTPHKDVCACIYTHRPVQGLACVSIRDPDIAYRVQI